MSLDPSRFQAVAPWIRQQKLRSGCAPPQLSDRSIQQFCVPRHSSHIAHYLINAAASTTLSISF